MNTHLTFGLPKKTIYNHFRQLNLNYIAKQKEA